MADDNPELEGPAPTPAEMGQGEPDNDEGMGGNELCVPLAYLAQPDEGEGAMVNPEVGDKGSANVEWTLNRVDGDNGYVTLNAVNGNKIEAPEAKEPSEADQMGELQQMAAQQPERY